MVSFAVACNSWGLEENIAADWEAAPLGNIGYLLSLSNVVYILFGFFHFLHRQYKYLEIKLVSAFANWMFFQSSSSNCGISFKVLCSVVVA